MAKAKKEPVENLNEEVLFKDETLKGFEEDALAAKSEPEPNPVAIKDEFIFINNSNGNPCPSYCSVNSSKMKISASFHGNGFKRIYPGEIFLVPTGISCRIPDYAEIQVRTLDELALKEGLIVLNSPAHVGPEDEGEIKVMIQNASKHERMISNGQEIAELFFATTFRPSFHTKQG